MTIYFEYNALPLLSTRCYTFGFLVFWFFKYSIEDKAFISLWLM